MRVPLTTTAIRAHLRGERRRGKRRRRGHRRGLMRAELRDPAPHSIASGARAHAHILHVPGAAMRPGCGGSGLRRLFPLGRAQHVHTLLLPRRKPAHERTPTCASRRVPAHPRSSVCAAALRRRATGSMRPSESVTVQEMQPPRLMQESGEGRVRVCVRRRERSCVWCVWRITGGGENRAWAAWSRGPESSQSAWYLPHRSCRSEPLSHAASGEGEGAGGEVGMGGSE